MVLSLLKHIFERDEHIFLDFRTLAGNLEGLALKNMEIL